MFSLKKIGQLCVVMLITIGLSGCLAAAVGAGAGGGYYFDKNYKIDKKKDSD